MGVLGGKMRVLLKRIYFLVPGLLLFSGGSFAATGKVTITSHDVAQTFYTQSNYLLQGTYVLTSDTSPTGKFGPTPGICGFYNVFLPGSWSPGYWDWTQWVGTWANLHYKVDGIHKGLLGSVTWTNGRFPTNEIGTIKNFSAFINIAGMPPRSTHTVTIFMQDIYQAYCGFPLFSSI